MSQQKTKQSDDVGTKTVLTKGKTNRGFGYIEFKDNNQKECSIQDSSNAMEPCIWFGVDNTGKLITGSSGQKNEHVSARMELTKAMTLQLLPILLEFVSSEKYITDMTEEELKSHTLLLNQLIAHKEATFGYDIGDTVKPEPKYASEQDLVFKVIGLPVQDKYGMLWTPVQDDGDEDGIAYFKSHTLMKIKQNG